MKLCKKLGVLVQVLKFWWASRSEKNKDCSCPNCGTSGFDGYCSWCKHKAEKGKNWYTDRSVAVKKKGD